MAIRLDPRTRSLADQRATVAAYRAAAADALDAAARVRELSSELGVARRSLERLRLVADDAEVGARDFGLAVTAPVWRLLPSPGAARLRCLAARYRQPQATGHREGRRGGPLRYRRALSRTIQGPHDGGSRGLRRS